MDRYEAQRTESRRLLLQPLDQGVEAQRLRDHQRGAAPRDLVGHGSGRGCIRCERLLDEDGLPRSECRTGDPRVKIRRQRRDDCIRLGIESSRICLDPGIGFGKTHEHNLELLRATKKFAEIGSPLLVGHSRKGFIAKILGNKEADGTAATLGVSLALAAAGADILRVHDVKPTVDALRLFQAAGGLSRRGLG